MSITTYDELKDAVADFLNRDDLSTTVETFISLAEADIQRRVRHWRQEKRSNAVIDTQYSAIPSDFLEIIRFHISTTPITPVELISQSEMMDMRSKGGSAAGTPKNYAITAGEIEVYPNPDASYNAELYYYSKVPALSTTTTTNWLLTYHSDAYLYGALLHSAPYLGEDARAQVWATLYQAAIESVNAEGDKAKSGGSGRRMRIRPY